MTMITALPRFLPDAEDRFVKGEGRGKFRPLVGEGAGRVCVAPVAFPPPLPPVLDMLPLPLPLPLFRLPPPEELNRAVCEAKNYITFTVV